MAFITDKYPHLGKGPVSTAPYTSPEYYEKEKEHIFKKTWIHVGRVEEIPNVGDYFVKKLDACDAEVIIARNKKGEVSAMHNVCAHRLNQIVYNTSGNARKFFCKFHGWAYDLDGKLTGVPEESNFFDLNKEEYGLTPVHVGVWEGFIFVNVDPNPSMTLEEYIKPVFGNVEGYPFDKMTTGFQWTTEVRGNWKLALDAFQEAYHVAYIHGMSIADAIDKSADGGMPPLDVILGEYHRRLSIAGNQKSVYGNPKAVTDGGEAAKKALEESAKTRPIAAAALGVAVGGSKYDFPLDKLPAGVNWTKSPEWLFDMNVIFPDFYVSLRPNYYQAYNFRPTSHNTTLLEARVYYPEMTTPGGRFFQEYMKVALRDVLLEDLSTIERTQYACETAAKKVMLLQDREVLIRHGAYVVDEMVKGAE